MLIYISHPYGGREDNKKAIEKIIEELVKKNSKHVYVSPVHCFGFLYETTEYQQGIDMCLTLLGRCDYMYVFGDWKTSVGCMTEIEYAMKHRIKHMIYM